MIQSKRKNKNIYLDNKNMQKYCVSNQGKENKNSISYKLGEIKEKQTKYQMNNNIDNNSQSSFTLSSLKKISKELVENMSDEQFKDMLERASKNGVESTFEEFYDIIIKNIISLNK